MRVRRPGIALFATLFVAACGGSGQSGAGAESPTPGASGSPASGDPIAGTPAWDEHGKKISCALPEPHCPGSKQASIEFQDQCRLAGFRMIQCGCDNLCTGNVSTPKEAYDSKNVAKPCAPAKEDCSPPDTSAAFQDACSDAGHKFVVCGCEWLCAGKLKGPVAETPPPADEEPAPEPDKKPKGKAPAPKKK